MHKLAFLDSGLQKFFPALSGSLGIGGEGLESCLVNAAAIMAKAAMAKATATIAISWFVFIIRPDKRFCGINAFCLGPGASRCCSTFGC